MTLTAEQRRAHEAAALGALRNATAATWTGATENGLPAPCIYSFADEPHPEGWTINAATRAAVRLEARGELVGIPGDSLNPRRWKLPAEAPS